MKIKRILTLAFCLLTISVFAQKGVEDESFSGPDFERLQKRLNLTDEQVEHIKNLNERLRNDAKTLREDLGITEDERKQRVQELIDAHDKRMQEVMTEDQYNTFREDRMKRRKKRLERRKIRIENND